MLVLNKKALEECRKHCHKAFSWVDTVVGLTSGWYRFIIERSNNPYAITDQKLRIAQIIKKYQALGVPNDILDAIVVFDSDMIDWSLNNVRRNHNA